MLPTFWPACAMLDSVFPWGRSQPKMAILGWWICGETLTEISLSWRKQKRSWAYQHAMVGCIISLPIMNIWCQTIITICDLFRTLVVPLASVHTKYLWPTSWMSGWFHCGGNFITIQISLTSLHSSIPFSYGSTLPIPPWSFQSQHPKLPRHAKARHCDAWAERPEMGCQAGLTGRWLSCSQHVLAAGDWGGE